MQIYTYLRRRFLCHVVQPSMPFSRNVGRINLVEVLVAGIDYPAVLSMGVVYGVLVVLVSILVLADELAELQGSHLVQFPPQSTDPKLLDGADNRAVRHFECAMSHTAAA